MSGRKTIRCIVLIICACLVALYFGIIVKDIVTRVITGPAPEQPLVVSVSGEREASTEVITITVRQTSVHTGFEACISTDPEFHAVAQIIRKDSTEKSVKLTSEPWDIEKDTVYYRVRAYVEMKDGEILYSDWTPGEAYEVE